MLWKVSTLEKKNVVQNHTYQYIDDSGQEWLFDLEEGWRWGKAVVECDEEPYVDDDPYSVGFVVSDYSYEDINVDDGCWSTMSFPDDMPSETKDLIENTFYNEGYIAFEELGIELYDTETIFYGPLELECVDDTPTETSEQNNEAL